MNFLDKAFLVLPMTMIIILGNIDVSVGSIVALSSVLMAVSYNAGLPMPLAMVLALVVGTTCGFINGFLQIKFKELSATIITLSTMTVFRGIAYVILEDRSAGSSPPGSAFWHGAISGKYLLS
jgi:rhamnose transport system permease protein